MLWRRFVFFAAVDPRFTCAICHDALWAAAMFLSFVCVVFYFRVIMHAVRLLLRLAAYWKGAEATPRGICYLAKCASGEIAAEE